MKCNSRFNYKLEDAHARHPLKDVEDTFDYDLFAGDKVEAADFLVPELSRDERISTPNINGLHRQDIPVTKFWPGQEGTFGYSKKAWGRVMSLPLAHAATIPLAQVTNTEAAPFSYICRILVTVGTDEVEYATGVLVGPKHVLTAAHPLVDGGSLVTPEQITVTPGVNGDDVPFGNSGAIDIITPKGFRPGDEVAVNDFALIKTERDFSKLLDDGSGFWGTARHKFDDRGSVVGAIPGWRPGRFKVNISGYPKEVDTQWHSYDDTVSLSQFELSGLSLSEQKRFLFFKNAIKRGMSGSPVWVTRHHSLGGRFDFAIVLGMKEINGKRYATGRVIDREVKEFIARHTRTKLRIVGYESEFDGIISKDSYPIGNDATLEFETFDDEEHFELLDFEKEKPCQTPCPSPPPSKGQFSAPNKKGHRWFTPEYRQYPSNLWHLAKVVRDRMLADRNFEKRGVPTESQVRYGITVHPCNKHFTTSKPMFMPRFGPDRCTSRGPYYGSIYIPFQFDGHTPDKPRSAVHPELGQGMALPSLSPDDLCHVAMEMSCAVQPTRFCFLDQRDDRVPVTDTTRTPNRWICEIVLVFSEILQRGKLWAFHGGSGLLISPSHVLTSAHLLHQRIDFGSLGGVQRTAVAAVILFGGSQTPDGVRSFPFTPILQKNRDAFIVPQEWKNHLQGANDEPSRYDYGVISLRGVTACPSRNSGAASVFPSEFWGKINSLTRVGPQVRGFRYDKLKDLEVRIAGYPGDLPCTQWTTSGKLTGLKYGGSRSGRLHYKRTARHDILTYDFDSARGMSGSPVWGRMSLKGKNGMRREERVLIGVHSRCGEATAITPYVWEKHMLQWMKES